ncbi:glycosyl transferase [Rhodococcus gordoniae]|uniref:Glycosyl transferase n=1 Tax=Rhodococcus gordoniae TaxID=223392 RepID=A0A379LZ99_9NOCA|nr:glycosyltransferase [Rhodococcus gordoniae]SUE15389.1 glycosyl transferase [Rhodococcus gordoniae]
MPHLSVILPVRNGEKFIRHAVNSTLRALPRDANLVILNDGSTDATPDILDSLACSKVEVIESAGCGGLANALNLLLDSTDSEYVARMDADDIVLPWRFKHQTGVRDADVVFSPVIHLGPKPLSIRPTRPGKLSPATLNRILLIENPIAHSTALFRRSAISAVGGYRSVLAEDYDLWLRIAAQGMKIHRTAWPALLYRHHSEQITSDGEWKAASRVEPLLLEAHEALARGLCGLGGDALSGLRDPGADQAAMLRSTRMIDSIHAFADEVLNKREGDYLRRKCTTVSRQLARRLEAAR